MLTLKQLDDWRCVNALDAYSDNDARMIYEETLHRNGRKLALSRASATFVGWCLAIVAMIFAGFLTSVVLSFVQDPRGELWWILVVIPIVTGVVVGMTTFHRFYQISVDRLVERELTPMIANQILCESCSYSLEGLPKIDDALRCPECGRETSTVPRSILDDLGIERIGDVPSFRVRPRP